MEFGTQPWTARLNQEEISVAYQPNDYWLHRLVEYFWKTQKCRETELKDFGDRFPPPHSGFLMCHRCWHIIVQLMFLVLEETECVGGRALFYLPMLLLFADVAVDFGWCLRIPSGSDVDFRITDKPFFGQRLLLLCQFRWGSPFVLCNHRLPLLLFLVITDKAQLFDMYQLRVKQKPRPKSQITRGRRMPPYQPVSYQVPTGS